MISSQSSSAIRVALALVHLLSAASAFQSPIVQSRSVPGDMYSLAESRVETKLAAFSLSFVHQKASTNPQVDDYLEFLERRYSRLHEDDDSTPCSPDKAFQVLGVSELASERLLSKYHIVPNNAETATPATQTLTSSLSGLSLQRKRLLDYQDAKLRKLAVILMQAIKNVPGKAVKKLVVLGGGKKTMSLTFAVMSVLMFTMVRPMAQTLLTQHQA